MKQTNNINFDFQAECSLHWFHCRRRQKDQGSFDQLQGRLEVVRAELAADPLVGTPSKQQLAFAYFS
jgi:hypothetical protein